MLIINTRFVPAGFQALTIWPLVLIRPEAADDRGLIAHERVHWVEQGWSLVLPWWLLYLASRRFRLAAEVRAYRRQIAVGGISLLKAAMLLTRYRLGITLPQAVEALECHR